MTLVQLRHFVALVEMGSYVRTATSMHLTQPALSRSINALEEELGQRLFDRIGRRINLTAFGAEFLVGARRLVADAAELKATSQSRGLGQTGRIRLGLTSGPGAILMVPILLHMASERPRLHIEISRGSSGLLLEALRAGKLDALVADIRLIRPASDLVIEKQVELKANFLCRPDHPILQYSHKVSINELREYPIASTPLSDEAARLLTEVYGPNANPDEMVTLRSDETPGLVEVAHRSNAIVLTVEAAARSLVPIPVDPPMEARGRFGLVTVARRAQAPAMDVVRELIDCWLRDS